MCVVGCGGVGVVVGEQAAVVSSAFSYSSWCRHHLVGRSPRCCSSWRCRRWSVGEQSAAVSSTFSSSGWAWAYIPLGVKVAPRFR